MTTPAELKLPAMAQLLLEEFEDGLTNLGLTVPERSYVAPGSAVPWDGEQLVINLQTINQGQPGSEVGASYATPNALNQFVALGVWLVREVPSLETDGPFASMVPSAGDLGLAGATCMADAEGLIRTAIAVWNQFQVVDRGMGFSIGPLNSFGPEGGLSANRILLNVSLS